MNKKLRYLTKNSLLKKVKSKWFVAVNVIIFAVIVGLVNIDSIINLFGGDFNEKLEMVVIDNTGDAYDTFETTINNSKSILGDDVKVKVKSSNETEKVIEKKLGKKVLVVFNKSNEDYLKAKVVSSTKIDSLDYQLITSALTTTKYNYGLKYSNIDPVELSKISSEIKIDRIILDEDKKSIDDNMDTIMGTVFPTLILPFFMLVVFLVQMIGAEIYEEKSSRSMEIIISNVSPKTHFMSKILSSNIFAISQGLLLFIYAGVALLIRNSVSNSTLTSSITTQISDIFDTLVQSGFVDKLIYIIPLTLVLLVLSFIAYSLVAGILASMTVNMEDYQQIQTPVMLISVLSYYLAMMAGVFDGSLFIKILSYLPFISCLLSPALLVLGQVGIIDVLISVVILILFNIFVMKKGIRIYKEGILNYSNEKVWSKFKKIVRNKD